MSLCRGLWGREHACIGKCVSALTQPHKAFPFALLKSNSHRLCSSFTSLCLSWCWDLLGVGTFPSWVHLMWQALPRKKKIREDEQQKKWNVVQSENVFSCCFSTTTLFIRLLTLMFLLWTSLSSAKWYFVCVRIMCHWSGYLPHKVWIKFIDASPLSIRMSINCYSFSFPSFTKRSCLMLSSVAVQLFSRWMSQKTTVLLLCFLPLERLLPHFLYHHVKSSKWAWMSEK